MSAAAFESIAATYRKFGWVLRRVLATAELRSELGADMPGVTIRDSTIDAAWFSRPPRPGEVAWEIRYLGEPPFALVSSFDEASEDFEPGLTELEDRLKNAVAAKA